MCIVQIPPAAFPPRRRRHHHYLHLTTRPYRFAPRPPQPLLRLPDIGLPKPDLNFTGRRRRGEGRGGFSETRLAPNPIHRRRHRRPYYCKAPPPPDPLSIYRHVRTNARVLFVDVIVFGERTEIYPTLEIVSLIIIIRRRDGIGRDSSIYAHVRILDEIVGVMAKRYEKFNSF